MHKHHKHTHPVPPALLSTITQPMARQHSNIHSGLPQRYILLGCFGLNAHCPSIHRSNFSRHTRCRVLRLNPFHRYQHVTSTACCESVKLTAADRDVRLLLGRFSLYCTAAGAVTRMRIDRRSCCRSLSFPDFVTCGNPDRPIIKNEKKKSTAITVI